MNELDSGTFLREIRIILGRIFFHPENISIYINDLIHLFEENKNSFDDHILSCNDTEKITYEIILDYLKVTKKNEYLKSLIEKNMKLWWPPIRK